MSVLLKVDRLSCTLEGGDGILKDISFVIQDQDVLILQGKSGCGKTTLLKSLAHLNVYEGDVFLHGKSPSDYGVPIYRTRVLYVPQRPSLLPGTPREFIARLSTFSAYKQRARDLHTSAAAMAATVESRAIDISRQWDVDEGLWDRLWSVLSGGEAQRIALAGAVALNCAEVLLLDEPTSALDSESSALVEKYLINMLKDDSVVTRAIVWITHSSEQGQRVGTRFITVANGGCIEEQRTHADS